MRRWRMVMKAFKAASGRVDLRKKHNRNKLLLRFLKGNRQVELIVSKIEPHSSPIIDVEMAAKVLREKEAGKAPGLDGITFDFLKAMMTAQSKQSNRMGPLDPLFHGPTARFTHNLAAFLSKIADCSLARDESLKKWMTTSRGVAVAKGEVEDGLVKDVRPISIQQALVSLAHSSMAHHPDVLNPYKRVVSETDVSHGVRGATDAVALAIQAGLVREGIALAQIDYENAFGSIQYQYILDLAKQIPALAATLATFFGLPVSTIFGSTEEDFMRVKLERGIPQGAPLSGLLLALATATPRTNKLAKDLGVIIMRYVDDISLLGPAQHLAEVFDSLRDELLPVGVMFNLKKCCIYIPGHVKEEDRSSLLKLSDDQGVPIVEGVMVLGTPIGTDEFVQAKVSQIIKEASDPLQLYEKLIDTFGGDSNMRQSVITLLRLAVVPASLNYLLRTVPERLLLPALKEFDQRIIKFILWVLKFNPQWLTENENAMLRERVWLDAVQGGAGIPSMARIVPFAHLGAIGLCLRTMVDRNMLLRGADGSLDLPSTFPEAHRLIQSGMLKKVKGFEKETLQSIADRKEPIPKLQRLLNAAHRPDRLNSVLALMDKDSVWIPARADLLSRGSYPAAAWLFANVHSPEYLAHHCILSDEEFVVSFRDLIGISPIDTFHDLQRPVQSGMVLSCGLCDPAIPGVRYRKTGATYMMNDREAALHATRCTGTNTGGAQAARTKGHKLVQDALQTVAWNYWKPPGFVTTIKLQPPMADHFPPKGVQVMPEPEPAAAAAGVGAAQKPKVKEHRRHGQFVLADIAFGTTGAKGTSVLDVTMHSNELPRHNQFCRPPPPAEIPPAVQPMPLRAACPSAFKNNVTNDAARASKESFYKRKWNTEAAQGAHLVIAAIEHGGRWDNSFKEWFDGMFKQAIEDKGFRAMAASKAYQIIAVAARKAVAGVHLAMHHMRHSSYRMVKPPPHLMYLLPPRQQAH